MHRLILAMTVAVAPVMAIGSGVDGVWKTEANDDGAYIEVTIGPCDSDSAKTCGKISNAFTKQGPDLKYENIGKLMIIDMKPNNGASYSGGTIWDPEKNKTYSSKMTLKGEELDVEGCVSIICTGQHWTRGAQPANSTPHRAHGALRRAPSESGVHARSREGR